MFTFDLWKTIDEAKGQGTNWQILGYPQFIGLGTQQIDASRLLAAGKDLQDSAIRAATPALLPINPLNPVKHVRVTLNNSSVYLERGAMQIMKGKIAMEATPPGGGGVGGFLRRAASAVASGEPIIKPKYTGSGDIFLEPRRDYLFLIEIDAARLMCDRGMFVGCDGSLAINTHFLGAAAAAAGGEGVAMPVLEGTGVALLASPVPLEQIMRIQVQNEELKIDGPYAMLSMGDLEMSVERIGPSAAGSAASGEGMVNVYRGTGQVWVNLKEAKCF